MPGNIFVIMHHRFQESVSQNREGLMAQFIFPHLKKLVTCTDGSLSSQGAVNAGVELGRLTGAKVYLLQVLVPTPSYEVQDPEVYRISADLQILSTQEKALRQQLEEYKTTVADTGIDLEARVHISTSAYHGILEEADAVHPEWIIIGRKGWTGLKRLLLGSATARVIGHSPYHILVVPRDAVMSFRKILIAHDGSMYAEAAWRETIPLAEGAKSDVVAVSVARDERREMDCRLVLQHLEASAERHGISLQTILLKGQPFEQIIKTAQDERVDLIVMGSHGRTGISRLLLGSVAERVIGTAQCPVLVAKLPEGKTFRK